MRGFASLITIVLEEMSFPDLGQGNWGMVLSHLADNGKVHTVSWSAFKTCIWLNQCSISWDRWSIEHSDRWSRYYHHWQHLWRQRRFPGTYNQPTSSVPANNSQDLTFFFDIHDHPELHFPENADRLLESKPKAPIKDPDTGKKGLPECKDFFGLGFAQGQYHLNGRIHALPPQQGIPGFQRVTMMKYLPSHEGVHGPDHTQFWAYEGCVLPGGQIILGRWWSALHPDLEDGGKYSGPFMFWCVDGTQEDKLKTVEEAAKFINDLDEFIF